MTRVGSHNIAFIVCDSVFFETNRFANWFWNALGERRVLVHSSFGTIFKFTSLNTNISIAKTFILLRMHQVVASVDRAWRYAWVVVGACWVALHRCWNENLLQFRERKNELTTQIWCSPFHKNSFRRTSKSICTESRAQTLTITSLIAATRIKNTPLIKAINRYFRVALCKLRWFQNATFSLCPSLSLRIQGARIDLFSWN